MPAGKYRKRITIQSRVATPDVDGGIQSSWVDVVTVWARVTALSGNALIRAQAIQSSVTHAIEVRWNPLLSDSKAVAAMRVNGLSRPMNILASLDAEELHKELTLLAVEGLTSG